MKRRWSFDDGIFDAMCKWALSNMILVLLWLTLPQRVSATVKALFCFSNLGTWLCTAWSTWWPSSWASSTSVSAVWVLFSCLVHFLDPFRAFLFFVGLLFLIGEHRGGGAWGPPWRRRPQLFWSGVQIPPFSPPLNYLGHCEILCPNLQWLDAEVRKQWGGEVVHPQRVN